MICETPTTLKILRLLGVNAAAINFLQLGHISDYRPFANKYRIAGLDSPGLDVSGI